MAALLQLWIWPLAALGDEAVDAGFEHRQGDRAQLQHRVVEGAVVELGPERVLGLGPALHNRHLAQKVTQRQARPDDVADDLGLDLKVKQRREDKQELLRLFPRPALGM